MLRQAATVSEIEMITHDLRPAAPVPKPPYCAALAEAGLAAPVPVAVAPSANWGRVESAVKLVRIVMAVVGVLVIGGVAVVIVLVASRTDDTVTVPDFGSTPGLGNPVEEPNVLSKRGLADLVGEIEAQTGSSEEFEAVLYPTYAVVDVPVDPRSGREASYFWDGELREWGSKGTTDSERFDLGTIRPRVVVGLVEQAKARVEDPSSWYAIVRAPRDATEKTWIWGYATNEFGEPGYVGGDRRGTVTWDPMPESA